MQYIPYERDCENGTSARRPHGLKSEATDWATPRKAVGFVGQTPHRATLHLALHLTFAKPTEPAAYSSADSDVRYTSTDSFWRDTIASSVPS